MLRRLLALVAAAGVALLLASAAVLRREEGVRAPVAVVNESPRVLHSEIAPYDRDGYASRFNDGRVHRRPLENHEFRRVVMSNGTLRFFGVPQERLDAVRSGIRFYRAPPGGRRGEGDPHFPPFEAAPASEAYDPAACGRVVLEPAFLLVPYRLGNAFHAINSNVAPLWYNVLHADPRFRGALEPPRHDAPPGAAPRDDVAAAAALPRVLYEYRRFRLGRQAAVPLADELLRLLFPGEDARRDYAELLDPSRGATCFERLRFGQGPWGWTSNEGSYAPQQQGLLYELQKHVLRLELGAAADGPPPPPPPTDAPRVLYLARRCEGRRRCLANRDELREAFLAAGAASYVECCRDWGDVRAMLRAVASADVVAGMHGANLANAVFARPGSVLLEMAVLPRRYFDKLAYQMRFPLQAVGVGDAPQPDGDPVVPRARLDEIARGAVAEWRRTRADPSWRPEEPAWVAKLRARLRQAEIQ